MAVTIKCPNPACGRSGTVSADLAGQTVRCPHCRTRFTVPAAAEPPAAEQTQPPSAQSTVSPGPSAPTEARPQAPAESGAEMPARIGRFELRARLGAGAFGTVYRA